MTATVGTWPAGSRVGQGVGLEACLKGSSRKLLDSCGEGPFVAVAILGGSGDKVPPVVCAHFHQPPASGLTFVYRDRLWSLVEKRPSTPPLPRFGDLFWEARPLDE